MCQTNGRGLLRRCPTGSRVGAMLRQSPFHARVAAANQTSLWSHWAGHLVVDKYQMAEKWEYVAVRNACGVFDSSPLYKYRITGPDAERYLGGVLARDVRTLPARAGPVHDLVRRPRVRERGRRRVPPQPRRVLPHRRRTEPVVLPEPHRVRPGRDRGGHRALGIARDPGATGARDPVATRAGDHRARLLRPHARQARRRAGVDLAYRLHRRSRLRGVLRRRPTRTRCGTRCSRSARRTD